MTSGDDVVVEAAATSANLGPGFDCLGLALGISDVIEAGFASDGTTSVEVLGEGAGSLPTDTSNLVARVVHAGLAAFDPSGELATRPVALRCRNDIPQSRGLGSSAAAIVGGLAVAAELVVRAGITAFQPATPPQLVALGTRLEGHPDNIAAGVLGGATIAWMESAEVGGVGRATRFPIHPDVVPVIVIPSVEASTSQARRALPRSVPHADAAFNAGRAALLVHALSREPRLLLAATEDRLHQQQRRAVYPTSMQLVTTLRAEGIASAISGAGPTVIAFAVDGDGPDLADRIREVVHPDDQVLVPGVAEAGVRVL